MPILQELHKNFAITFICNKNGDLSATMNAYKPGLCSVSPILIEIYRSATSCNQINEVVSLYSEFEQQAWFSLTPLERRRVVEIMSS